MCDPVTAGIAIGAAVGAGSAAATGGDPLMGAIMGGAAGGFFPGSFGITPGNVGSSGLIGGATLGSNTLVTGIGFNVAAGGLATGVGGSLLAGSLLNPLLNPPSYDLPQQATPVAFQSNQTIATTGSGGGQAQASLSEAIRRSKRRKLTQDDVSDLSIDTSSFSSVGLQLT